MKQKIKKAALQVGRPIWKRLSPKFYSRIDKRIDLRLAQTEIGWKQHVPAFLNAVSSVQAFSRELVRSKQELHDEIVQLQGQNALVRDTLRGQAMLLQDKHEELARLRNELQSSYDRVEFIRREIMFEMRYAQNNVGLEENHAKVCPHIVNSEKVSAALKDGVKLNLGCGHLPIPGYLNVDMRELPGVDIVADVRELPFESSSLREVFSAHLVEHFPQEELVRLLLPHWYDLLSLGGVLRAVAPDGEAMLTGVTHGNYAFEDFREVLFGAQEYEGDFHYNLLTPSSLSALLKEAGFHDINVPARGRRNGKCFEFEISATK